MKTFTFGIRFRFDSADFYETTFDLALSDEEIAFVKVWLNDNGEMPFWAFEYENEELFGRKNYRGKVKNNEKRPLFYNNNTPH